MQSYDEMVNSGTDWLGYIPAQWSIRRGKFLYQNKKVVNKGMTETQRLALTLRGVIERKDGDNLGLNPESLESYQIFEKNDLVFKLIDLENKQTSRVGLTPKRGIMSPAYIRLTPKLALSPGYFFYYYYSLYLTYVFNNIAGEGVRANLSAKELLELPAPVPSLQTQQKIADFLDTETAQIDNLIAKQERLLELLEEKRRATITHAVTRGLDPNVELKETNIPWLGQIPAHWGVERVAALYRRKRVKDHPDEELLSVYRDYGVIIKSSRDDNHNTESEDLSNYQLVEPDDLVTNKMKTWQGSIAVSEIRGIVSPAYFIFSPTSQTLNPRYVHYQLRSDRYIAQYKSISKGIRPGQWDLDYEQFRIMRLTVPPIGEQAKIVKHIEDNEIRTKAIKQKIQTQIALLRERRTSLISHAVTGKIKI